MAITLCSLVGAGVEDEEVIQRKDTLGYPAMQETLIRAVCVLSVSRIIS